MDILRQKVPFFFQHCSGYYDIVNGTSPLLLPKAKANGLQSVKLFGGTEQSSTPTPTVPVDIVCNNGVVKYGVLSTNLLDLANCTDGYYYTPSGEYTTANSARLSNYIPVKAGVTYTAGLTGAQGSSNVRLNLLDTEKNWLSQTVFVAYADTEYAQTITPTQDGFFVFSANYTANSYVNWDTAQVVEGSYTVETMPAYEPYREGIYTDGTVETVEITGKNLYNPATRTVGYILNDNGEKTENNNGMVSDYIQVMPETTYTFYFKRVDTGIYTRIFQYNSNKEQIGSMIYREYYYTTEPVSVTFTTASNAKYLRITTRVNTENIQLELGSTATTYEPYYNGGQATAEMLLKVGDYQDVQSVLDGNVTRKVGVKVLDGTETFTIVNGTFRYESIDLPMNNKVICNYFDGNVSPSITTSNQPDLTIKGNATYGGTVYFKYTAKTTVGDFKAWLADQYANGTPVIVVYPLATATTETVTPQTLQVQAGDNTLTITQASLDDLTLEAEYKRGR